MKVKELLKTCRTDYWDIIMITKLRDTIACTDSNRLSKELRNKKVKSWEINYDGNCEEYYIEIEVE